MKDTIIKGTGNSRYLKSNIPADITHEQLVQLLRNGTMPIDLNGVNMDGIEQLGTPLNTATMLQQATAALLGLEQADPTVDDAFVSVQENIDAVGLRATEIVGDYKITSRTDVGEKYLLANGANVRYEDYPTLANTLNYDTVEPLDRVWIKEGSILNESHGLTKIRMIHHGGLYVYVGLIPRVKLIVGYSSTLTGQYTTYEIPLTNAPLTSNHDTLGTLKELSDGRLCYFGNEYNSSVIIVFSDVPTQNYSVHKLDYTIYDGFGYPYLDDLDWDGTAWGFLSYESTGAYRVVSKYTEAALPETISTTVVIGGDGFAFLNNASKIVYDGAKWWVITFNNNGIRSGILSVSLADATTSSTWSEEVMLLKQNNAMSGRFVKIADGVGFYLRTHHGSVLEYWYAELKNGTFNIFDLGSDIAYSPVDFAYNEKYNVYFTINDWSNNTPRANGKLVCKVDAIGNYSPTGSKEVGVISRAPVGISSSGDVIEIVNEVGDYVSNKYFALPIVTVDNAYVYIRAKE